MVQWNGALLMKTYTTEEVQKVIDDIHRFYSEEIDKYDEKTREFTIQYMKKIVIKSMLIGLIFGILIGIGISIGV